MSEQWGGSNTSNLDGSLTALAVEINALDVQAKGVQEAMGRKLLEVREILRARNGERASGSIAADGRRPPNGWKAWVSQNLKITYIHATDCIRLAVDPEGVRRQHSKYGARKRQSSTFLKTTIKRIWPRLSEDERNEAIDLMLSLSDQKGAA